MKNEGGARAPRDGTTSMSGGSPFSSGFMSSPGDPGGISATRSNHTGGTVGPDEAADLQSAAQQSFPRNPSGLSGLLYLLPDGAQMTNPGADGLINITVLA